MPDPDLPKPGEILAGLSVPDAESSSALSSVEKDYLKRYRNGAIAAELDYEHLKGVRAHYKQKEKWSWFLMLAVGSMLIFQSILLWLVGIGSWNFTEYEWLLPALLVQNLGQVIGLAVFAVRYLFSDISGQK